MPQGVDLEVVPKEVREAVAELIQPVYERLVLEVDDPLEKSLGVTVAHLLWLEVLQQFDMKREYVQFAAVLGLSENRGPMIEQHLRIIHSKVRVGYFLARLRELRQQWDQRPAGGPSLDSNAGRLLALPKDRHVDLGNDHPEGASC